MSEIYLRNAWLAAALGGEVGENLMRRVILDEPILLLRDDDGNVAALRDMCPHRYAPLSRGKRKGGGVECGYHGLVFAPSGKCILNPHGDGRILPSAKVASYPAIERYGLVWIWLGEPALADPGQIPDLGFLDASDQRTRMQGHQITNANYQLLTDNILDLSHADFLHPLLDSGGGTRLGAPEVKETDDGTIVVSWTWGPTSPFPFLAYLFEPDALVHSRIVVRWYAPATMDLLIDCALEREGLDDGTGINAHAMHVMTPETARSTHYFFGGVRSYDVGNDEYTRNFAEGSRIAFADEDKPMIEAVQANMGENTDIFALRPLGLIGDAGGVRVREKLRRLIDAERQAVSGNL